MQTHAHIYCFHNSLTDDKHRVDFGIFGFGDLGLGSQAATVLRRREGEIPFVEARR